MRYHLIVNDAASGTDRGDVDAALGVLEAAGADTVVHDTAGPDDLDEVLDRAGDGDVLVVCGGDGSVHLTVRRARDAGLLDRRVFAIIPMGTGNDLATSLGIPADAAAAARALLDGSHRGLDLIVDDTGEVCVNALHAGIGVDAAARAQRLKDRIGDLAYPLGALAAGVTAAGWAITVEVDGQPLQIGDGTAPVLLVAVMNAATFGGGTRMAPDAVPDDGLLDVVLTTATGPAARASFGAAMASGTHLERADVRWRRGREVRIRGEAVAYNIDGELDEELMTDRTLRIQPGAWTVVAPLTVPTPDPRSRRGC